jgi:hypothetical protein
LSQAELAKQQYEGAQNDSSIATTKLVKVLPQPGRHHLIDQLFLSLV